MKNSVLISTILAIFLCVGAQNGVCSDSSRATKKIGLNVSIGEPLASIWGINASYNILSLLKATAGYGSTSLTLGTFSANVSNIGFGLKATHPEWNFSPMVGLGYSISNVTISGAGSNFYGITASGSISIFQLDLGLDWQTDGGFFMNGGYKLALSGISGGSPYLGIGWFF